MIQETPNGQTQYLVDGELVAAQGPVAKVRVNTTGGNIGIAWTAVAVNDYDSLPMLANGTMLYTNATPCARCAEAEHTEAIATKKLGEEIIKTGALLEKLAERDEEIRTIRANLAQLEKDFDRRNERIEVLEAEVEQWKIHAKEILSGEFDKVIHGLYLQATIERQRKVIELSRLALSGVVKAHGYEGGLPVKALAAIAELEKGDA